MLNVRRRYLLLGGFAAIVAIATLAFGIRARSSSAAGDATLAISAGPVTTSVTITLTAAGSGVNPYLGYNIGIPFDPTLVTYTSKTNVLPGSPFCLDNAAAGNEIVVGCTLFSTTTYVGDLGSLTFTLTGTPGCFDAKVFPYDGTNLIDGTYLLDPTSAAVANVVTTSEIKIPVSGGNCNATPTATATNTATATATATKTNTATATATATKTNTATATATN
ncbi:MAG TPA: hypothetical protein VEZ14_07945, partial [Dehalococcoidia bacterium]|nr:hypothetical protein [Dehalococcoidia bacterium]